MIAHAAGLTIDEQNPWPGLSAFDEAAVHYFNGRREESAALRRLVTQAPLTVLFGASGLGKSSLLKAGLFPLLRQDQFLPVYVRLDLRERALPLLEQVTAALQTEILTRHVDAPALRDHEPLWEYLHRRKLELWSEENRLLTPLFAFDQFEEVFTLGSQNAAAIKRLRIDLADLIENRMPDSLAASATENESADALLSLDRHRYKVLLSFREDFLPAVEGWKREIPSITRNRLRLLPMSIEQAFDAVHATAPHLADAAVARRIVSFVAAAGEGTTENASDLTVEPALLSLVCHELNEKRKAQQKTAFDEALFEGTGQAIVADFYQSAIAQFPATVQRFIERELITERGFRKSCDIDDARQVHHVTDHDLSLLVDRRLIRIEPVRGTERVELIHDLLTSVVRLHRDSQREQERLAHAADQAAERERDAANERELEQAKTLAAEQRLRADLTARTAARLRLGLMTLVAFSIVTVVLAVYAFKQSRLAASQSQLAAQKTELADKRLKEAADAIVRNSETKLALLSTRLAAKGEGPESTVTAQTDAAARTGDPGSRPAEAGTPAPARPADPPSLSPRPPTRHLIVLMLENRSFDHMLGYLKSTSYEIDGLTGDEKNRTATAEFPVKPLAAYQGMFDPDPAQTFQEVDQQLFNGATGNSRTATMEGFITSYSRQGSRTPQKIMYAFKPDKLPVLSTLAAEFAICDRWFSSLPGPSLPNRAFAHFGTSFGHVGMELFYANAVSSSIFERLAAAGRTAKLYVFDKNSATAEVANLLKLPASLGGTYAQFLDDARSGRLPDYSFIEPNFSDHDGSRGTVPASDQHPDHHVAEGERFIASVYNAIRRNETLWRDSILLITYSNHGGFYDHVPPPSGTPDGFVAQPKDTGTSQPFNFDRLGVRVPAVIVSPYIRRGTIDHTVYDHASIPATASKLFASGAQKISPREQKARTFETVLTLPTPRTDAPEFNLD